MDKYQVNPTLCRLAAITISKHLWRHSHLRDALNSCIDNDISVEEKMPAAVKSVMDEFLIPEPAKEELMFAVGAMGWEIGEMLNQLIVDYYEMDPEGTLFTSKVSTCIDYVCWTTIGSIDPCETMRSFYFAGFFRASSPTWHMLSCYCLEDCITDLWSKISMDQYSEWRNGLFIDTTDEYDGFFPDYWIARMRNNLEPVIDMLQNSPYEFHDDTYSLEQNMLINSFIRNQFSAVKYFWKSLDENQRMRTIAKICEKIMSDDPNTQEFKDLIFSEDALTDPFLMFFLQQLSYYGFDELRIKMLGSGLVLGRLLDWPYDNLFMNTLRESWIHHDSIDYGPIISHIILEICNCEEFQLTDRDIKYRRIFCKIWNMNPQNLKNSVDYKYDLRKLWESKDVQLLKRILGDEELMDRRQQFLNGLIENSNHSQIDMAFRVEFSTKVLVSLEEQLWFGRQITLTLANRK